MELKGGVKMTNKSTFATNLKRFMALKEKSRKDLANDLGISYYTVTDWVKGKKYPRMDKVEMLANYFGVLKSDLIEEKTEEHRKMQKNNNFIAEVVVRMRTDEEFMSVVEKLNKLDADKLHSIDNLLSTFL